jgi:hypothetical protein
MKYAIDRLKHEISKKIGYDIKNATDLKHLESIVNAKNNGVISYNTLRRFYDFLPATKLQNKSLNILSGFVGYESFNTFLKYVGKDNDWYIWMNINSIENKDQLDKTDILFLETLMTDSNYVVYLASVVKIYCRKQQMTSLRLLFSSINLFPDSIQNENFSLKFASSVSLILRILPEKKYKKFDCLLNDSYLFKSHVLYFYIDYHHLNGYYGYYLEEILKKADKSDEKLFLNLVLNYRSFLNNDSSYTNLWIPVLPPNLYSILCGRYWGYQLLYFSNHPDTSYTVDFIWENLIVEADKYEAKNYFFMEIIPALIFTKNFDKIKYIIQEYYEELFDFKHWNHNTQLSNYLLASSICEAKESNYIQAYKSLKLINFNINDSYEYYFKLFYLLVEYKLASLAVGVIKDPIQVKEEYMDLVEKTGFKRFSLFFLEEYFE